MLIWLEPAEGKRSLQSEAQSQSQALHERLGDNTTQDDP